MARAKQYEQIGNMFRTAREALRMNIDEVSRTLYIRARYIRALEEGSFHELPGPAYVKGYMLAYAQFLNLDEKQILRQFHTIEADLRRNMFLPAILTSHKNATPVMVVGGMMIALIAIMVWLYPQGPKVTVVENIDAWRQQLLKKGHVSDFSSRNDACFQRRNVLYPPCYASMRSMDLLPLKRRMVSVMDLKML